MRPLERALIQSAWYPYKKWQCGHARDAREAHSQGKDCVDSEWRDSHLCRREGPEKKLTVPIP